MLLSLTIKNVALIKNARVDFCPGLNILTGETGAGKSMIIDALYFLFGQKTKKDFFGNDAFIECAAECDEANARAVSELGVDVESDNVVMISRSFSDGGKQICRANGKTVSLAVLKSVAVLLLDFHGQHEHQDLLKPERHADILDKFGGGETARLKQAVEAALEVRRDREAKIAALGGDMARRAALLDMYAFQINEIEQAALSPGEDERLNERKRALANAEEINKLVFRAASLLCDDGGSAAVTLGDAAKALNKLRALSPDFNQYADSAEGIIIQLSELTRGISAYKNAFVQSPGETQTIEERLDLIYNLKRKYGKTVEEILAFLEKTKEKYSLLEKADETARVLSAERDKAYEEAAEKAAELTNIRRQTGKAIALKAAAALSDLAMENAEFDVKITQKEQLTSGGFDKVEFFIAPNKGFGLMPLAQIASGGEISRVMLALKCVLSAEGGKETFVFDEVDTGVSGGAARKVAEKLRELSETKQVICITHSPQVAAFADRHFLVEKIEASGQTNTFVTALDGAGKKRELAKLIGGAQITQKALAAAEELILSARRASEATANL